MSASSDASAGKTSAADASLMPARREVLGVGRIAADEVDAVTGRVLVELGEDHDLLLVVVAAQLLR